ncbi:sensor histidine kinase [Actinomadura scrupuli]|uniref:sensor histidine kinase n=1 Tax=Actinomadura scrupuli TaxID=559629 RepID=UPI003D99B46E
MSMRAADSAATSAEACERLQRFTADASHELRSPIAAIRTQVEEALLHPDDTDWQEVARAVLAGVDRLQTLVTDLMVLTRLDAGAPLTRQPADLARLVAAEVSRCARMGTVVTELCEGVFADCDHPWMTRLLAGLLDNADRHATSQITVIVRADDRTAVVEIIDDGPGIPAEHRDKVFGRFTRLDAARSRATGGAGLGLAIARRLAQAHGGSLAVEDSPRGARLVLRVPRCDPPADL